MDLANFKKTKNLSYNVCEYIREKIFLGEYHNGDRILEQELADELNISRAPIREAIKDLTNQGLLKSIPNKGTFVIELSEKDIKEIFKIRTNLESEIIKVLVEGEMLNEDDFNKLQRIVEEMKLTASMNIAYREKAVEFSEKDIKFHQYLWQKSGQKWTLKILSNLYYQLRKAMIIDSETQQDLFLDAERHEEFLHYLKKGDLENTISILKRHMVLSQK